MQNLFLAAVINIDPIYLFCNLILLMIFIIAGDNVSRGYSYWKNALVCSAAFVLILGSRYLRGNDYAHYVYIYLHADKGHEFIFTWFNKVLREFFGVSKYLIFYIYAIPFILAGFKFLKNYKRFSKWMFPLFLVVMIYFEEYEIRQAFGFSFVFLFLSEFIDPRHSKKIKILFCAIYVFFIVGTHSANIIFIFLFLLLFFAYKQVIPYQISIPLLIFATYIFPELYDISYLNPILNLLGSSGNAKFEQYTQGNAAEAWFGNSAIQLSNARNPVVQFLELLANSSLFYFACKFLNGNKSSVALMGVTLTNLFIIGDIGRQAFLYFEILNRISGMLQRMWFVPFVFVIARLKYKRLEIVEWIAYLLMMFLFYDYAKYLIAPSEDMTMFLWDI